MAGRGYTLQEVRAFQAKLRFSKLSDRCSMQLAAIEPSHDRDIYYYPCLVTLNDGTERDFVYLVEARSWLAHWGPTPLTVERFQKNWIDVDMIVSLRSSPNRLPAKMADKLYAAGETGMGGTTFTVLFRDGSSAVFSNGNIVDFINYPPIKSAADVEDVLPHVGLGDPRNQIAPMSVWAPFELGSERA